MRIFIVTGEPSGDLHGANLAQALQELDPHVEITGVGGTRMRAAGVSLIAESEHWGAIGIAEALRKVPSLWGHMRQLVRELQTNPPDVLVPIDFGAFNVRLLRRINDCGIKTVYFIPPGCWSRHRAPGQLPFLVDAIATPFPWSAENLRAAQAPATITWVGHPLIEYTKAAGTREEIRKRLGIEADRPIIALVPGSRRTEVRYLLSIFYDTMRHITPSPLCLVTVAPSIGEAALRRDLPADVDIRFLHGMDYATIPAANAALVASGTATLELACMNIPMVVAYRGSFGSWLQYQFLLHTGAITHIALPNLLAEDYVVPELLQHEANPQALARELTALLADTPSRRRQLETFEKIRPLLGEGHACRRTAEMIMEIGARAKSANHVSP